MRILQPELLRRLLIGRRMLCSFCPSLTPESDALAVAQAILLSHDAAELVLSAIAESVSATRKTDRMALMDYVNAISEKTGTAFAGRAFFESLNRERVSFKHYGIPPNREAFHRVVTRTYEHPDQACVDHLQ